MKKFFLASLIILLSSNLFAGQDNSWNVSKSTHFIVYYKGAPAAFIGLVIEKSEDYYGKIADELGVKRFNFWLWDKRAKIYIYDNSKDYLSATGQPGWSAGCAQVQEKTIKTFLNSQGFQETVLPHEMGHIIFRELVGFDNGAVPIWLDEGVASYQEKQRFSGAVGFVKRSLKADNFLPLEKLSAFASVDDASQDSAELFYAESFSIIDYLIREFGKDNFLLFCQNLKDKKDLKMALVASYPFKNIREFEDSWKKYLMKD